MNIPKLLAAGEKMDFMVESCVFFFDWVINHTMVQGHVEQWITIMDFENVGVA